jgi:hypothetical protein
MVQETFLIKAFRKASFYSHRKPSEISSIIFVGLRENLTRICKIMPENRNKLFHATGSYLTKNER